MTAITSAEAKRLVPNWQVIDEGLETNLEGRDFRAVFDFLTKIADLAEAQQHHPDFNVRYNRVWMRVTSHDIGGLSNRDIQFATAAEQLIEESGLTRAEES